MILCEQMQSVVKGIIDIGWAVLHPNYTEDLESLLFEKAQGVDVPPGLNRQQTLEYLGDKGHLTEVEHMIVKKNL